MSFEAYIGTYTSGASKGIYHTNISPDGTAGILEATPANNPSYLAFSPDLQKLYAVNETERFGVFPGGAVSTFALEEAGRLRAMGLQASCGAYPCHILALQDRLYAANYGNGTLAAFLLEEGMPQPAPQVIRHTGHGPNRQRQEGPHTHCVTAVPGSELICAVDLGIDQILFYQPTQAGLELVDAVPVPSGAGPRHVVFSPDGRLAWLACELSNEVCTLRFDNSWSVTGCYPTLPDSYKDESTCAAIRLSPDGKLLCVSNRGHDSIACFRTDSETGSLSLIGIFPTGGKTPRDIAFSPDGALLLAANQDSGTITALLPGKNFALLGEILSIPNPICILPRP